MAEDPNKKVYPASKVYALKKVLIGLGWDMAHRSFLDKLRGILSVASYKSTLDADLSLILCGRSGKVLSLKMDDTCVYYGQTDMFSSVHHDGDNIAGVNHPSHESITVDFEALPNSVRRLIVVVTIKNALSTKQDFGRAGNAYVTLIDLETKSEFGNLELARDFAGKNGVVAFEFTSVFGGWNVKRVGVGYDDIGGVEDMVVKFR